MANPFQDNQLVGHSSGSMDVVQPLLLYKYRDDSLRSEQIITGGKVWLSNARALNDPLECKTGQISEAWMRKCIREMENAQMAGFMESAKDIDAGGPFYSLSNRAAKRWFKHFKSIKTREEKYSAIRRFLKDHDFNISRPEELFNRFKRQLAQVGIFSLTECPDNTLMWSHYAKCHTGLAIGFGRVSPCKLSSSEHTLKVMYENSKPTFGRGFINQLSIKPSLAGGFTSENMIGFSDPTFRAAFSTKPVAWNYEKEWRYVEETSGLFPLPGPINSVVFGLKMKIDRRKHYASLISRFAKNTVEYYEVVLAADNANIEMIPWSASKL